MIHEPTKESGGARSRSSPPIRWQEDDLARTSIRSEPGLLRTAPRVPPLLPILLPLVIAAIVTGVVFAWLFPPVPTGQNPPSVRFTDVTAESGLLDWPEASGVNSPTTLGGGVVCFDYDADGDVDLLFVKGTQWPWETSMAKTVSRGSCVLFRNNGEGRFTDVTALAGLNVELQGMSAAAGDFDNDGLPDLYVSCVGSNHLFHNRGKGRFEDVTDRAGVGGELNTWSTGATWIDVDNDGRLDLVVAHYARWAHEMPLEMAFTVANVGHSYGTPTGFVGVFPSLYRNLGDGRFGLVRDGAGLRATDPQTGFPLAKALAVIPVDANEDGKLELLFTYHAHEAVLFLNQADGTFRRWGGGAERRREGISAGLGAASSLPFAQLSGTNERLSALQSVMSRRPSLDAEYVELSTKLGVVLLDYDLDGRVDVFAGNGRAEPDVYRFERGREFSAKPSLWWNRGGEWIEVSASETGGAMSILSAARGIAGADFDGDGDTDIVVAQQNEAPRMLRNELKAGAPWLQIELVATKGAKEAGGARVEVHTPSRVLMQTAGPAMGFMAQSASTLTIGLGDDARVRKVVVHWPSGNRLVMRPEGVNRKLVLTEP